MANRTVLVKLVAETSAYTSGLSKASAATMRLGEQAGATGKKSKDSFDLAGKGALVMGGLAVAGLGMAISKSAEFESAMSAVHAATQASVGTMGDLRAAAMKAGADTSFSATEAAQGITEMAKAGVSAKDIMGGGLSGALSLAAAGQIDVADAAGIASVAMTQFKLSGQDLPHVADLLAAGAGKAMGSVDDLGQALNQAGLVAAGAGFNIEETTGTLAAFASAGLLGSDAGTSLKTMIQRLQAATPQASQAMSDLGISVYDSNGNMLSMAGIAGQLKDHLGGLTQEQRNNALATIFGSDAVRAANVLYEQGAAGISDWTAKVNDAGYASKQAADLQDNLAGDIEKLGGSFDTLLINVGSGTQGPLRELVQSFTGILNGASDLINVFANLPGPVQAGIAAFGGLIALKGPLSGMVGDLPGKLRPLNLAFDDLRLAAMQSRENGDGLVRTLGSVGGAAGGAALDGVKSLAKAIGPELGIAVAGAAIGMVVSRMVELAGSADAARAKIADLTFEYDHASSGEKYAQIATALSSVETEASKAKDRLAELEGKSFWQQFWSFDYAGDVQMANDALDAASSKMDELQAASQRADGAVQTLGAQYGMTKDEVVALAQAHGIDLTEGIDKAQGKLALLAGIYGDVNPKTWDLHAAVTTLGDGSSTSAQKVDAFNTVMDGTKKATDDAKKSVDQFKLSLDILTGAHVDMIEVESAFYGAVAASKGALDNMTGSVLTSSGSLNMQSDSGRKAADVLLGVRDSGNQLISTMIQQGDTADVVKDKDAQLRKSFIDSAIQMGISRDAANKLADQILGIPAERQTKIDADTKVASDKIGGVATQVNTLPDGSVTVTANTDPAKIAIDNMLRDYTNRQVNAKTIFLHMSGSEMYTGGYTGPGGKYEPAGTVHKGEVVFSQEDVAAHGGPWAVESLRKSRPGYANGGIVGLGSLAFPVDADTSAVTRALNAATAQATAAAAAPGGSVERWRPLVLQALSMLHQSPALANGVLQMIKAESGGNPNAINLTDSNARAGHPSRGLMQTIPSTFAASRSAALPNNIVDPLANIFAGINYALKRYGPAMIAAGGRHTAGGGYLGYETGTSYVPKDGLAYLHQGEAVLTRAQNATATEMRSREMAGARSFSGGSGASAAPITNVYVTLDGRELKHTARIEAQGVVVNALSGATSRGAYNG